MCGVSLECTQVSVRIEDPLLTPDQHCRNICDVWVYMNSPNIEAARRLDRLLRLQILWRATLISGWLIILCGAVAVSMTVRRTPDQLTEMLAVNPKLSLTILPWMPAPPNFRILGVVLMMVGIALVSLATIWNRKTKTRSAA